MIGIENKEEIEIVRARRPISFGEHVLTYALVIAFTVLFLVAVITPGDDLGSAYAIHFWAQVLGVAK